ncbi:MAG: single-stranded-DNA-specific exonuclease RecJ [Candidatus Dormibacteria bacterium]
MAAPGTQRLKRAQRDWLAAPRGEGETAFSRIVESRGMAAALARESLDQAETEADPLLLSDMAKARDLIAAALRGGERSAVYGDYDADGVTACALLVRALRAAGHDPLAYIPQRESEGYGLNREALIELRQKGAALVITVDCGTTAVEVVRERPQGLTLIITDHHLPHRDPDADAVELAAADALVNPQRPGDRYPFKGLAGVGVAYQLVRALELAGLLPLGTAAAQLPLVALGTVADMMPLQDENRSLVRRGLAAWIERAPLGLRLLARASGGGAAVPGSSDLAFGLAPRINAAGRMDDAWLALRCCLADHAAEAEQAAARLEELNRSRRTALAAALLLARAEVEGMPDHLPLILLGSEQFSSGVVGLVAGRLAEEYGRPAFVYSRTGERWRGSVRGVPGLNVVEALRSCAQHLVSYGGHLSAGGFSLAPQGCSEELLAADLAAAVRQQLGERVPGRTFLVDAEVCLSECGLELADELLQLQPCGTGNPAPLLCATGLSVVRTERIGKSGDHLKLSLRDQSGSAEAITFNRPQLQRHLPEGRRVDALFELEVDCWRGRRRPRLLLRDLRPARA